MPKSAAASRRSRIKNSALAGGTAVGGGGIAYAVTQSPVVAIVFATIALLIVGYLIFLAAQRVYPRFKAAKWELGFERLPEGDGVTEANRDTKE
jgi:hypothetical protein